MGWIEATGERARPAGGQDRRTRRGAGWGSSGAGAGGFQAGVALAGEQSAQDFSFAGPQTGQWGREAANLKTCQPAVLARSERAGVARTPSPRVL